MGSVCMKFAVALVLYCDGEFTHKLVRHARPLALTPWRDGASQS